MPVPIPVRELRDAPSETPASGLGSGSVADKIYAREREFVALERSKRPIIPCEVQALRVSDLGIVTNGAEFFCQLGLDIKAASPFKRTWVVSLANEWIGYVVTPSAYYAGGYEPRTAWKGQGGNFGPGNHWWKDRFRHSNKRTRIRAKGLDTHIGGQVLSSENRRIIPGNVGSHSS